MYSRKPLSDFWPRYATVPGRRGMGLSIYCPSEQKPEHFHAYGAHRITLWFLFPDDGEEAYPGMRCYHHLGTLQRLSGFTVYDATGSPLEVEGHWEGYIIDGLLQSSTPRH